MSEVATTSVLADLVKGAAAPSSFGRIRTEAESFWQNLAFRPEDTRIGSTPT